MDLAVEFVVVSGLNPHMGLNGHGSESGTLRDDNGQVNIPPITWLSVTHLQLGTAALSEPHMGGNGRSRLA